ncbi:HTH domain transcriptional regulator QseD [compost metagenome]
MLADGSADYVVALLGESKSIAGRLGLDAGARGFRKLTLGEERLIPVTAPNAAGQPLFDLSRRGQPVSFLGYADECHLGWALQPHLQEWSFLNLQQAHSSSLTDGLRFMALSQLGMAWLPETLVRNDLSAKKLMRAGDSSFDIPLRLTLFRQNAPMGTQAESLWMYLSEMAKQHDDSPLELTDGLVTA